MPPRMSPPTQPGRLPPPPEGRRVGLAVAAMICGILSVCLPPLALIALPLGIVAVVKASRRPTEYGGMAAAIVGICIGVVGMLVLPLLLSIMLPSLARARELSKRAVCAANLQGLGLGLSVYATGSSGWFPIAPHPETDASGIGLVDYTQAIGSYRGKESDPTAGDISLISQLPNKISTTRNPWTLIRSGHCSTGSFICPSSNDRKNIDNNPRNYWDFGSGDITGPVTTAQADQFWHSVSYGYQVPYGKKGRPSSSLDPGMAIMADKGPYSAAIDAGLAAPLPLTNLSPGDWGPWNSPNHGGQGQGEGQNVLYADGSVRFVNSPIVGVDQDNIYTQWSGDLSDQSHYMIGNPPTAGGRQIPLGDTDSLIYP